LEVAGDDPGILANAAFALAYFGEDIGAMMGFAYDRRAARSQAEPAIGLEAKFTLRISRADR
jgi:hypothetical protein